MKKIFVFAAVALAALFSACQNVETEQAPVGNDIVISLNASIADDGPVTRTLYDPVGRKVLWGPGDQLYAKFASDHKDNIVMSMVNGIYGTGQDHTTAIFSGKVSGNNYDAAANPSDFVFYYPGVSGVGKGGTVTDADNFVLENIFPKVQNSADVLFQANWLYGTAKAKDFLNVKDQVFQLDFDVAMRNVMAVLDFTVKGEGALKRIYVTDMDTNAPALWGAEKLTVENGVVTGLAIEAAGTNDDDRTIIAEFNKPVALSADGAHVYVTIFPRTYSKGLRVGFELENGDYMVKKLAENTSFTLKSSQVYTVPAITFASTVTSGKGFYDGVEYSYDTFTDPRDNNIYKVATLKDGRTWMLDNLRYIPSGLTPSNDLAALQAGIWFPVIINDTGDGVKFGTAADAARFGYLYNYSVALGQAPDFAVNLGIAWNAGTMTADEASAALRQLNGGQGICPDGWHVPTEAEYTILYTASGSSLSGLGVQGFVIKDVGAISVSSTSDLSAKGMLFGYAFNKMNTSYVILSTAQSYMSVKAIMPHVTNNMAAVSSMKPRFAAQLRCIKDN